jgi:hypothetical protein
VVESEVAEIYKSQNLEAIFGASNIPTPTQFVELLLGSGLLYDSQNSHMFFHDSFEDWLLREARLSTIA